MRKRRSASRDIGYYSGYGPEAWNDELLIGDTTSEPQEQVKAILQDAEEVNTDPNSAGPGAKKESICRPTTRITDADTKLDVRSLSRSLSRTLYLLVRFRNSQVEDNPWTFPGRFLQGKESLHQVNTCSNPLRSDSADPK